MSARGLLLALLLGVTCFYANLARDSYTDDFRAFWVAAQANHDGLDPYRNQVNVSEKYADGIWLRVDSRYIYPPSALLFFAPLAHVSYKTAKIAFGFAMALTMVGILMGLQRRFPRQGMVLLACFISLPMFMHVDNGQIDALILGLVLLAFYLEDGAAAGALLGVAIAVKFSPVLALVWFVARGRWRTAAWSVGTFAGLFAVAYELWGGAYFREFAVNMAHHEDPGRPMLAHAFTTIQKVQERFLLTPEGPFAYQHDIGGYLQNPVHLLGRFAAPVGVGVFVVLAGWLLVSRRGRGLTAEQSFFLFLPVALLANPMLWTMGLVACFPLLVLLVDSSETPNLTAVVLLVPFLLTKQIAGNWNFALWLVAAGWCVWRCGWLRDGAWRSGQPGVVDRELLTER